MKILLATLLVLISFFNVFSATLVSTSSASKLVIGTTTNVVFSGVLYDLSSVNEENIRVEIENNPFQEFCFINPINKTNNSFEITIMIPSNRNLIKKHIAAIFVNNTRIDQAEVFVGGEEPRLSQDQSLQIFTGLSDDDLAIYFDNLNKIKISNIQIQNPNFIERRSDVQYASDRVILPLRIGNIDTTSNTRIEISYEYLKAGESTYFNRIQNVQCSHNYSIVHTFNRPETIELIPNEFFISESNNQLTGYRIKENAFEHQYVGQNKLFGFCTSTPNVFIASAIETRLRLNSELNQFAEMISLTNPQHEGNAILFFPSNAGGIRLYGYIKFIGDIKLSIISTKTLLDPTETNEIKLKFNNCRTQLIPTINDSTIAKYFSIEKISQGFGEMRCIIKPIDRLIEIDYFDCFSKKFNIQLGRTQDTPISTSQNTLEFKEKTDQLSVHISQFIKLKVAGEKDLLDQESRYSETHLIISFNNSLLNQKTGRRRVLVDATVEDKLSQKRKHVFFEISVFPSLNILQIKDLLKPDGQIISVPSTEIDFSKLMFDQFDIGDNFDKKNALITITSISLKNPDEVLSDLKFRNKGHDGYPIIMLPPSILIISPWSQEEVYKDGVIQKDSKGNPITTNNIRNFQISPINIGFGWHWNPRKPSNGNRQFFSLTGFFGIELLNITGNKADSPFDLDNLIVNDETNTKDVDFLKKGDFFALILFETKLPIDKKDLPIQIGVGFRLGSTPEGLNYKRGGRLFFAANLDLVKFVGSLLKSTETTN